MCPAVVDSFMGRIYKSLMFHIVKRIISSLVGNCKALHSVRPIPVRFYFFENGLKFVIRGQKLPKRTLPL